MNFLVVFNWNELFQVACFLVLKVHDMWNWLNGNAIRNNFRRPKAYKKCKKEKVKTRYVSYGWRMLLIQQPIKLYSCHELLDILAKYFREKHFIDHIATFPVATMSLTFNFFIPNAKFLLRRVILMRSGDQKWEKENLD